MNNYNSTERELRLRIRELHCVIRHWRAIALMFGALLLACAIVIVLQYAKLP
jgi:hypothetical protein